MNIKGRFEVTLLNQKTFETKTFKGENLITNIGKNYLSKWLMHSALLGGNGVNEKIITNSVVDSELLNNNEKEIVATNYCDKSYNGDCMSENSSNCLTNDNSYAFIYNDSYDFTDSDTKWRTESSIYFDFKSPKNIRKIIMKANACDSEKNDGGYYSRGCYLEISTSTKDSKINEDWEVKKYVRVLKHWNISDTTNISDLIIYLGDRNDPERAVENVKSIRITPYYYGMKIYNIAFFEEVDYPSPPCVIGLGTSSITPNVKDIDLGKRVSTLLAKCTYEEDKQGLPTVTYRTKLGIREFNGNTFKEIGLFCVEDGVLPYKGQNLELFSHGLFEIPWEKTSDVIADIKYVLTTANDTGKEL